MSPRTGKSGLQIWLNSRNTSWTAVCLGSRFKPTLASIHTGSRFSLDSLIPPCDVIPNHHPHAAMEKHISKSSSKIQIGKFWIWKLHPTTIVKFSLSKTFQFSSATPSVTRLLSRPISTHLNVKNSSTKLSIHSEGNFDLQPHIQP